MTPNPNPSPELLPCPFCGGEASLTVPSELVTADCADIYVACDECESEGQHIVVEIRDRGNDIWSEDCAEARRAWNTRALSPPTPAETVTVALPGAGEEMAQTLEVHAETRRLCGQFGVADELDAAAKMLRSLATVAAANDEGAEIDGSKKRVQPLCQPVPDRIYLLDCGSGDISWCDDPDPDGGNDDAVAVEYVRVGIWRKPIEPEQPS